MNKKLTYIFYCGLTLCLSSLMSCTKFVEVDPPVTTTTGETVFDEDGNAIAALTSIYTNMAIARIDVTQGWLTNICFTTGLTGDELSLNSTEVDLLQYAENSISPTDYTWYYIYRMIFMANSAIEQLPKGKHLTPAVQTQLLGEAKFIRSFCYFYLVNLYGDVPFPISTDYQVNRALPRTPVSEIYTFIVDELKSAQTLLNENFVGKDVMSTTDERVRPNKWAATALLARTYLYMKSYSDAEREASKLIDGNALFQLDNINDVFIKNSRESIWQIQSIGLQENRESNTREGQLFKLSSLAGVNEYKVYLSEKFVEGFDKNDLRRSQWIDSVTDGPMTYFFPYKYKLGLEDAPTEEYSTVLRLGEMYLIRAEARIKDGNISGGITDLNSLRLRATSKDPIVPKLSLLATNLPEAAALVALENERKFELFTEWGHRWFDLKRTPGFTNSSQSRADEVLGQIKPGWQSTDQLFPLPQNDLDQNPNLRGHQNPGY